VRPALDGEGPGGRVDGDHHAGDAALLPLVLIFLPQAGHVALAHDEHGSSGPGFRVGGRRSDNDGAVAGFQCPSAILVPFLGSVSPGGI